MTPRPEALAAAAELWNKHRPIHGSPEDIAAIVTRHCFPPLSNKEVAAAMEFLKQNNPSNMVDWKWPDYLRNIWPKIQTVCLALEQAKRALAVAEANLGNKHKSVMEANDDLKAIKDALKESTQREAELAAALEKAKGILRRIDASFTGTELERNGVLDEMVWFMGHSPSTSLRLHDAEVLRKAAEEFRDVRYDDQGDVKLVSDKILKMASELEKGVGKE